MKVAGRVAAGLVLALGIGCGQDTADAPGSEPGAQVALRDAWSDAFAVGAAVTSAQLRRPAETALLGAHFDTVVSEYEMKADRIAPAEGAYTWAAADAIVDHAAAHGLRVRGHALVWHQSTPDWFLAGGDRKTIRERLTRYVGDVVSRYRGRVFAWDVVNEVVGGDADGQWRDSAWYRAAGTDYIRWAFEAASEADPDCLLFLNDYGTERETKLARVMSAVESLRADGVPIDGIGHQFHLRRGQTAEGIERALDAVAAAGLVNHVTELDVSAYRDPGSCFADGTDCAPQIGDDELPAFLREQALVYRAVFDAARARPSVEAVLTWGLHDGQSWLNGFPIERVNHPLLFDRERRPKPALRALVDAAYEP